MANMIPISTVTVGSGGAATMEFNNIPQNYTDLLIKVSARADYTGTGIRFNNDTANNYTWKAIRSDGSNASSENNVTYGGVYNSFVFTRTSSQTSYTANTFGITDIYIPNYGSANQKGVSADCAIENNATLAWNYLVAGLWTGTNPINKITLLSDTGNYVQYSSATLYGIRRY